MNLEEEARAAAFREQQLAQCAARRALAAALGGDPDRRLALGLAWAPVFNRNLTWDPPEDC